MFTVIVEFWRLYRVQYKPVLSLAACGKKTCMETWNIQKGLTACLNFKVKKRNAVTIFSNLHLFIFLLAVYIEISEPLIHGFSINGPQGINSDLNVYLSLINFCYKLKERKKKKIS